mmetsp:Transcript_49556/g.73697  ORF Transcript_49556/g.73697 Transcript_49556/m.73697 type:complete len:260 (+) Transcript_49556:93-872(+)
MTVMTHTTYILHTTTLDCDLRKIIIVVIVLLTPKELHARFASPSIPNISAFEKRFPVFINPIPKSRFRKSQIGRQLVFRVRFIVKRIVLHTVLSLEPFLHVAATLTPPSSLIPAILLVTQCLPRPPLLLSQFPFGAVHAGIRLHALSIKLQIGNLLTGFFGDLPTFFLEPFLPCVIRACDSGKVRTHYAQNGEEHHFGKSAVRVRIVDCAEGCVFRSWLVASASVGMGETVPLRYRSWLPVRFGWKRNPHPCNRWIKRY